MNIITSDRIKERLIEKIKKNKDKKKLLIISQSNDGSVMAYKRAILKRCEEFKVDVVDKVFSDKEDHLDIKKYCDNLSNIDGYIILQPLNDKTDIKYLRKNMPFNDLDGFTYESLGEIMDKDFSNMPQTANSVIKFIEFMNIDLEGKDVVIANSNNVIGKPLFMYLNAKKATVTMFNSKSKNQVEKIKRADIFISAIGKAKYYDNKYFRDGQVLIDVGTSYVDGILYGDIDYDSISSLDVNIVSSKKGVGSITTLSLIESLLYKNS